MNRKGIVYEIRVCHPSEGGWEEWFEGMNITTNREGVTVISGRVVDQAKLHGFLNRIQELNMIILSVRQIPDKE